MSNETILNGRYRLIGQQGSGGMAVIYRGIDQELGRTVAVKTLRPSLIEDPSFLARFRNEARSVANLAHPNIVTVYDVGSDGRAHFIVMEFIEGLDLKRIIKADAPLPLERALYLAIQICAGIGFAHRAGLVHADVKPQNILVTLEDTVKVTDFGIAQAFTDAQPGERQAVVWGSPHYFAPEQARGEKPTPASDVYSIGIVLFEMLTGKLPYSGQNQQELALAHIREAIPNVRDINPAIPDPLAQIVFRAMSKEPTQRYRMADQLGSVLTTLRDRMNSVGAASRPVQAAPAVLPPPVQPSAPYHPPAVSAPAPGSGGWQTLNPPPPVQPQPSMPMYAPPGRSADPLPTQRVDLAPNAPQPMPYQPQSGYGQMNPGYPPPAQPGYPPPQSFGAMGNPMTPNSGLYPSQPMQPLTDRRSQQSSSMGRVFDPATLALALLALIAVMCLIPLYIAVFQARFGG